jgi:hypothetical protein
MSDGVYYNQGSRGWLAGCEKEEKSRVSSRRTHVGEDLGSFKGLFDDESVTADGKLPPKSGFEL